MTAHIAPAEPDDLAALIESAAALFAEDGGTRDQFMDPSWPERAGAPYYSNLIAGDDSLVLLAWTNPSKSQVIGHLTGKVSPPNDIRFGTRLATLQSLRVHADHRRDGIARAFVERFLEWAQVQGAAEAGVTAYCSNEGAQAFYRSVGFVDYDITLHRVLPRASPR